MTKRHLRHPVVVLLTAIISVMALGSPAAAVPVNYRVAITGGTLTLTKAGVNEPVDLDPTDPSCTDPSTLDVNFTSNTASSNVSVLASDTSHLRHLTNSTTYLIVITRSNVANSPGHITTSTAGTPPVPVHHITSLRVSLSVRVYAPHTPPNDPCEISTTPICQMAIVLHLNGTSTSISTSNTFSLTGASVGTMVANPTCPSGPSYLLGTSSTVTSPITGHLESTF